jgi:hypothetical protein
MKTMTQTLNNELYKALSQCQAQLEGAKKDSANPFFKSKYADLESVWSVCRKPLSDNGLSIIQLVSSDSGTYTLRTILAHSSGQSIGSDCILPIAKPNDPQALGSSISYMRRYCLAAMVGVYQSDDDAETAMIRNKPQSSVPRQQTMLNPYVMPIGEHTGKAFKDIPQATLENMRAYLLSTKSLTDQQSTLLSNITSYLNTFRKA